MSQIKSPLIRFKTRQLIPIFSLLSDPFVSGLGRAAEQVQKGVIPNKARGEELATQQFNAAKKEQVRSFVLHYLEI